MFSFHRYILQIEATLYNHVSFYGSRIIAVLLSFLAKVAGPTPPRAMLNACTAPPLRGHTVCEQSEVWVEEEGELVFSHTSVILRDGDQYSHATTSRRYGSTSEVDLRELDNPIPIPSSKIWPPFPAHFTRAPDPLPQDCYVKRPNLLDYGYTEASTNHPSNLLLDEAQVCEILRTSPHPNIAQYLGCIVESNTIKGLCFVKYDMNLSQRVKDPRPLDIDLVLHGIEKGLDHLHSLGLIHCDINPSNILMNGDTPVIGDFDSCQREGQKLGIKAGTKGWTNEDFEFALRENDEYGLSKIRNFLAQYKNVEKASDTSQPGSLKRTAEPTTRN
jgi:serine/threonine protein kinase